MAINYHNIKLSEELYDKYLKLNDDADRSNMIRKIAYNVFEIFNYIENSNTIVDKSRCIIQFKNEDYSDYGGASHYDYTKKAIMDLDYL